MTDDLSLKEYIAIVEGNIKQDITALKIINERASETILRAVNKHESRISKLENWRWLITGGLTVLVFMIGLLMKFWR